MKKLLTFLLIVFCSVVFMGGQAFGLALSLDPSTQEIGVGDVASVDLNISGLGDFAPDSLGAFLVEITFDPSILSFESVTYGPLLGDTDPLSGETDIVTTVSPGVVSLDEFSWLFDFELDDIQPASFTLASLTFAGLAPSFSSNFGFGDIDLSDAIGSTIFPDTLNTASVTVTSAPVPEPATIFLMVSGLFGMGVFGRKKLIQK